MITINHWIILNLIVIIVTLGFVAFLIPEVLKYHEETWQKDQQRLNSCIFVLMPAITQITAMLIAKHIK